MPTKREVDFIKSKLLQPALTSHFEVEIPIPDNIQNNFKESVGARLSTVDQDKLNLLCSEVSLPGSSLATLEINNDFTGVTERHAYRRIYDDRIDLTFYVDAQQYLPIVFFESWIKYIAGEAEEVDPGMRGVSSKSKDYFYRVRYPDTYIKETGLKVIKFERDYKTKLEYEFIRTYPISIQSMPVSYDASNLLKCTVSMSYIRYIFTGPIKTDPDPVPIKTSGTTQGDPSSPVNQAAFNDAQVTISSSEQTSITADALSQNPLSSPGSAKPPIRQEPLW